MEVAGCATGQFASDYLGTTELTLRVLRQRSKGTANKENRGGLSKNHLPGGLITADRRGWVPNEKKEPQRGIALPRWEASGE